LAGKELVSLAPSWWEDPPEIARVKFRGFNVLKWAVVKLQLAAHNIFSSQLTLNALCC